MEPTKPAPRKHASAAPAAPGWRERKRQQTRQRITDEAMALFLAQGFEATTIEQIAAAAAISRRNFFHYFATKEEAAFAWQDGFAEQLSQAVRKRPRGESLLTSAQHALLRLVHAFDPQEALALARLSHDTPALLAHSQAKYQRMEQAMGDALTDRLPRSATPADRLRARMVAMGVIGCLRVATTAWLADGGRSTPADYAEQAFQALRQGLAEAPR